MHKFHIHTRINTYSFTSHNRRYFVCKLQLILRDIQNNDFGQVSLIGDHKYAYSYTHIHTHRHKTLY